MKHGIVWWLLIGWWWYLCFAWWLYPIKWILFGKSKKPHLDENEDGYDWRLLREAEDRVLDFLKNANGGTSLQVEVKKSLSGKLKPYFDDAVKGLYQNGKIKTSKEGDRIRLELVGRMDAE